MSEEQEIQRHDIHATFPADGEYIPTGIPGRMSRAYGYSGGGGSGGRRGRKGCKRACQDGCRWFRQGRCQAGHKPR